MASTRIDSDLVEYRVAQREALGWPASGFIVGSVSRLVPVKNHATLLRAVARVASQVPQLTLALVGDGPLYGETKDAYRAVGYRGPGVLSRSPR